MSFKPSGMKQGYHHWYAAKYFGGDHECAEAFMLLMDKLVETKKHKAFVSDFTQNLHIIVDELKNPEYYDDLDDEIKIKEHHLIGTYDKFVNYKKSRIVMMEKLGPTWSGMEKKEVICVKEGNGFKFVVQDKEVSVMEMKKDITDYLKSNNEDYKMQDDKKTIFVSEITQKSYSEVEGKDLKDLSVDKKTSAEVVVNFVENMKDNVVGKDYTEVLKKNLTSKQNEIPIPFENSEGVKDFVNLVLPRVTKNFMNHEHYLHNQDIAEAVVKRYNLDGSNKTALMLQHEFMKNLEIQNPDEMPNAMLFNPSWLETINFEKIKQYCPIYTGYKSCAWMLIRIDGYPGCLNKETLKLILTMVLKMAKFYGLWVRGGLKSSRLSKYVSDVLKLTDKKVYGFALHCNIAEWVKPVIIQKFKETSLFTVKEDMDIFDDDFEVKDIEKIFDDYTGPGFEPEKKKLDRDEGELNEEEKPKRGKNNQGVKRAKMKEAEKKKQKKLL